MDRLITFLVPTPGRDADYSSPTETFVADPTKSWSDFNPNGGQEFFRAAQTTAKKQGTFRIRFRSDVNVKWRISFDGDSWDIMRIDPVGRREALILYAQGRDE